ncbi:MAG: hypothetical protein NTV02_01170 [Candidatus Zambryskibacteria bacterium]|nr:hypothetical protein [Candidatus Zambryskibacteria bacterium]
MEILSKLFGSEARVKIMRLFLFNPDIVYEVNNIAERVKEDPVRVRKELNALEKISLIKRKVVAKIPVKHGKKTEMRVTAYGYHLNRNFSYMAPLQNFLINAKPLQPKEIVKKITQLGTVKLLVISGVFIQDSESRVDLLVVGDNIKKTQLENVVKTLEAEIGKELKYAYFTTTDFIYRLSMYDKLIRDILDYPHDKIINKLGL